MKPEIMRYKNDSISFYMAIIGLALDAVFLIALYSNPPIALKDKFGLIFGTDTIYNIVFMLIAFYTAEKVKTYALNWCYVSGAMGILQLPRILLCTSLASAEQLNGFRLVFCILLLVFSAIALIVGAFTSYFKSKKLHAYLNQLEKEVA